MIVQKFPKLLLDFPCAPPHSSYLQSTYHLIHLPSHFETFSLTHNHPFAFNFPTSTTQSPHNFALLCSRFSKKANLSYTQQQAAYEADLIIGAIHLRSFLRNDDDDEPE